MFTVLAMPMVLLPGVLASVGFVTVFIVALVVATRLLPFLVGQVIGQPMSLAEAWKSSRGNGIALTTALILVQVPLWILASVVNQILFESRVRNGGADGHDLHHRGVPDRGLDPAGQRPRRRLSPAGRHPGLTL